MRLRLRIVLLLIVAAALPMIAVYISLNIYSEQQRQSLVDMRINNVYGAAVSLYERKSSNILQQMKKLAEDPVLVRYLMIKDQNGYIEQQGLIEFATDMRGLLNLDYLAIIGADGEVLARGHDPGLFGDNLSSNPVFSEALSGQKIQSLVKLPIGNSAVLTSMGMAPIWYNNSRMIGIIAGGNYLDDEYCKELKLLSGAEIMLLENNNILAKTIPGRTDQLMMYLENQQPYKTKLEGLIFTFSTHPLYNISNVKIADLLMGISTHDLELLYDNMKIIYGGFALGGLLLAIILGYIFAARFTKPISQLTKAADLLAEGDFKSRVDYEGRGELGNLIDTFNFMAEDLDRHRQKLIETERLTAFTMMARKIAHEIKNPLTPIKIAIQDLRRAYSNSDPDFPDDFDRSTKTVLEEVDSLTKIVEEFSEFAKFPAPHPQNEDLNDIINSSLEIYNNELNEGTIKTEFTSSPMPVFVDKEQIKRVLINLIKNGLEAIPAGGMVKIKTLSSKRKATFMVLDNGPGLSPSAKENLFSPYFTTKPGGSGLGLVIVKKIINEHDGQIKIVDSTEGGAAAIVELPVRNR